MVCNNSFHPFSLQADSDFFVVKTLDRKTLWEMQTPQVICFMFVSLLSTQTRKMFPGHIF